ncbi:MULTISPECIES: hypothetical protein [Burkholderia]|nr:MULTISPECIES: hypothetical protein [unclassified Burkholderia]
MPIPWVSGHALARSVEKVDMSRGCPGEAGFDTEARRESPSR